VKVTTQPPASADVKNAWSYTYTPPIHLHGVVLSQSQVQLYIYVTIICEQVALNCENYRGRALLVTPIFYSGCDSVR
jgi:hypothetical protein